MTYFKQMYSSRRRLFSLLCTVFFALTLVVQITSVKAFAAGGVSFEDLMQLAAYMDANKDKTDYELYKTNNESSGTTKEDWKEPDGDSSTLTSANIPQWDKLIELSKAQNYIASDFPIVKRCSSMATQIVSTFGDSATYNLACKDVKSIGWSYDATNRTFTPNAAGDQHKFDNAIATFKSQAAAQAADNAFSGIYDSQNWNPSAGVAGDFLQSVYGVINTIFFVVSNIMIWFFLLQTSTDVLYIIAEPVRPFIGPSKSGQTGGFNNGGGNGNILSRIHIPICSSAVEQACNGGGGFGGNQAGGGRSAGNAFFAYAIARFPVLICCAVYLILVTLGYWPKLISWVSSFAVRIIDFIMRLGK